MKGKQTNKQNRKNKIDCVEFPAKSVKALRANRKFYAEVFGWSFQNWGDDYTDTKSSGIASGVNASAAHRCAAPLVVVYSANLEQSCGRVQQAGGKITRAIFSFPGGRRFHYRDPAGNELGVWSDKKLKAGG